MALSTIDFGNDYKRKKKAVKPLDPRDFPVTSNTPTPQPYDNKISRNISNQSLMGFEMPPESKVPDPRTLGAPPKQENPYGMWGAKMFGGKNGQGISVGQFATVAGMAAHALAPNEASGRMGAGIAAIANQGEQDRLRFEANAPEREAALQRIKLGSEMLNQQINDLPAEREYRKLVRERLMQDIGHTARMNPLEEATKREDVFSKRYSNEIQPKKDARIIKAADMSLTKADLDIGKAQFENQNMAQDQALKTEKERESINHIKESTDSLRKRTQALIEREPKVNTAQLKMEAAKAFDTLNMNLSARDVPIEQDITTGMTTAVIPTNEKGDIPPEIKKMLNQSGIDYQIVQGDPIKKDKPGWFTGNNYFRKVIFGAYKGANAPASGGHAGQRPSLDALDED